ncbi:MAG: phasin family protein [Parvularculaceae bacterium]|nr:phasin family protein [Parvularculaceae bacterium]
MATAKKTATRRVAKDIEQTIEHGAENAFADASAWSDAARDQYETALKSFNDSAEKFRADAEEALTATRDGFDAANERMKSFNADAMTAAQEEITGAVEFANELAHAKSIGDAFEIQRTYFTKLFETRSERLRSLTEASADAARAAFEPMTKTYASAFSFAPSFDRLFPFAGK